MNKNELELDQKTEYLCALLVPFVCFSCPELDL